MTVGQRIKQTREMENMTQAELGEKIGVSGVAIMRYEKGTRQPRPEQLQRIAAALNVSAGFLLDGSERRKVGKWLVEKAWKSDKASRLYMCIDSDLLDFMETLSKECGLSLEDKIEEILYWERERLIEEYEDKKSAMEFAQLPPEMIYPPKHTDASSQIGSSVAADSTKLGPSQSEQQKKPTPVSEDGLEEMFMRYVQELTPDQQLMILDQMQRLTGQQKEPSSVFAQQITGETTP